MDDILGNGKSDLEDLALRGHTPLDPPNIVSPQQCCPLRESDEVRRRVCIEKAQASGF